MSMLNFFMHIFNMSVAHLQSIKMIHWRLYEELIPQSIHYQPLLNMRNGKESAIKTENLSKKFFFITKLTYAHLQCVCNILVPAKYFVKDTLKAVGEVGFTKYAV